MKTYSKTFTKPQIYTMLSSGMSTANLSKLYSIYMETSEGTTSIQYVSGQPSKIELYTSIYLYLNDENGANFGKIYFSWDVYSSQTFTFIFYYF